MFQTPGVKVRSELLNKEANAMVKLFLKMFQKEDFYIEQFEEFEIKFINKDGEPDIFNLIKGKREILIKVEKEKHYTTTQYFEMISPEFDNFVLTFK